MLCAILFFIIEWTLKIGLSVILLLLVTILGLKLWLQPIKRTCKCDVKLRGKVVLITGGNSGIGLETARDLARRQATVIIASRDEKRSETAVEDIIKTTGNDKVYYKSLDLAKFASIKEFVENFNKDFDRLDILVNNSGCAGILPAVTEDGIEKVTQINYVGPFLLTDLLLDKLKESKPSRIVIVSSKANEFHDFDPEDVASLTKKSTSYRGLFQIYSNTKLCNILWAKALAKRLPDGVTVNALHPGVVMTNIFNRLSGLSKMVLTWMITSFFKTPEEGAQTSIYLTVSPDVEGISGEYFNECRIAKADKLVYDDQIVEKVWQNTMKLIEQK